MTRRTRDIFFQPPLMPLSPSPSPLSSKEVNCESYFFFSSKSGLIYLQYMLFKIHKEQYRLELPYYRLSDKLVFIPWPDVNPTGQTKNYSPLIFCLQSPTQFPMNSALISPISITLFHCVCTLQSLLCKFVLPTNSLGLFCILHIRVYTLALH